MTPRRRSAPKPTDKPPPADWAGKTLVVLRGGRRDGSWFFAEDFAAMTDPDDPRGVAHGYRPTSDVELHPDFAAMGAIWRHLDPEPEPGTVGGARPERPAARKERTP